MSLAAKFRRLSPGERRLLLSATALVAAVRVALGFWSFRRLRSVLAGLGRRRAAVPLPAERVAWAVRAAARRIPGARTCLVEALAAETLLARHGHRAELRIGVARTDAGIAAHAWLEHDGLPVFGHPGPPHHTLLPPLEPQSG